MKKIIVLSSFMLLFSFASAQRLQLLITDSLTYYIDTKSTTDVKWAPDFLEINAYSTTDGKANTNSIVLAIGPGNYAAYNCDTSQFANYSDWYLPSLQEANDIYKINYKIFAYSGLGYWTSSKVQNNYWAYTQIFGIYPNPAYVGTGMTRFLPYFCIRKEINVTTMLLDEEVKHISDKAFIIYDLTGRETEKTPNKVLIKKYKNGISEKVIYTE